MSKNVNEGTKTGVFWGIAVVMLAIATFVAWPQSNNNERSSWVGQPLFEEFKDPLTASSLKIVTFDEVQGKLDSFEVRKDRESGLWTIPSRNGYPADALEQMRDAANSLVALKILDIQTENAEDHDDLGVIEPKLETLEVGDEGVGRLVTFKDGDQNTLASLIIGSTVPGEDGKIYVRKPGQDPVYVVKLDETPLTTKFQSWIEEDLLQLSSIDISDMEIKDYNAALNLGMQVSLTRNYTANVSLEGSQWKIDKLLQFDPKKPLADPTPVEVTADQKPNATKLNEMKNALDELKIADVIRKPEGMSANLRADKDLLSDEEAVSSLASRGFFPVPSGPQGEVEVLSANGELTVGLKDGVEYVLRFGNVSGVSEEAPVTEAGEEGEEKEPTGGVNRYLLVTTRVNEAKFPVPELKQVPQTLEELEAMKKAEAEKAAAEQAASEAMPEGLGEPITPIDEPMPAEPAAPASPAEPASSNPAPEAAEMKKEDAAEAAPESAEPAAEAKPAEPAPATEPVKEVPAETPAAPESPASPEPAPATEESSMIQNANGTVLVRAQEDEAEAPAEGDAPAEPESKPEAPAEEAPAATETPAPEATPSDKPATETPAAEAPAASADEELSEEEKQEQLEAEQEKITKENQRKMDERKDKIDAAQRRVRELNARFADWYYVIPESTYSKLRLSREDLFEKAGADATGANNPDAAAPPSFPAFDIPGN